MSLIANGFGITDAGFVMPRMTDIIQDLTEYYQAQNDSNPVTAGDPIDVSPDSSYGQRIGIEAKEIMDVWELAQGVYNAMFPNTASGVSLSNAVLFTGINRLQASQSTGLVTFFGQATTTINLGTQVAASTNGEVFQTTEEGIIAAGTVVFIEIEKANTNEENFMVDINGTEVAISSTGDPASDASLLKTAVDNAAISGVTTAWETGRSGNLDTFKIINSSGLGITVQSDGDGIINIGTEIPVQAINYGAISAATGVLSVIQTPLSGLDSVYNFDAIQTGRDIETDEALRLRQQLSLSVSGGGSAEAIRARILNNVDGVESCTVIENDTNSTDPDTHLPAHSMMAVVDGGTDAAVAQEIWNAKAAGITSWPGVPTASQIGSSYDGNMGCFGTDFYNMVASFSTPPGPDENVKVANDNEYNTFKTAKEAALGGTQTFSTDDIYRINIAGMSVTYLVMPEVISDVVVGDYNKVVSVTDSQGNLHDIGFARPEEIRIYVKVNYTRLTGEDEIFPASGQAQIKNAILDYASTLKPGDNVIAGRFFGPIYNVPGLDTVEVLIGTSGNPANPPTDAVTIAISAQQYATIQGSDITFSDETP